ncbi:MAG: SCO family protein [Piscinibacter sp.]|uniref:SCO family protein n=1 Tax=Piscinibacter sp. TaxID=1903157 RepID=UPI00258CBCDE|nr:SCO family protein [Piscinibacter sp.]MCW5662274.1 SCO family protein [Piscinibacter sp.]
MNGPRRRELLLAAGALAAAPLRAALRDGPVQPPEPAPDLLLTDAAGRRRRLAELLQGRVTLVQLMFTGCSTVCPTQGLLFATLAARPRVVEIGWLSISIDALGDDPARLAAWQAKHGAHPAWQAAVPGVGDVERLSTWLRGVPVKPGTHNTQAYAVDAAGWLRWRSGEQPSAAEIERVVSALAVA